jgi:hypothetical protein
MAKKLAIFGQGCMCHQSWLESQYIDMTEDTGIETADNKIKHVIGTIGTTVMTECLINSCPTAALVLNFKAKTINHVICNP